jgi:putative ABC transport system permease protein
MSSPTSNAYFSVVGVLPAYFEICTAPLGAGRLLTMGDSDERRAVAVIGSEVRRVLFAGRSPLGETIYAAGMPFTVVGVLQRVGEPRYPVNVAILLPFRTAQRSFPPLGSPDPDPINSFVLQPQDPERNGETTSQVRGVLERRHDFSPSDKDAVDCKDYVEMYRQVQLVAQAMNLFLGGVGVVTLALGAVGVMNIMLVSVSERTLEIGIRKATGARSRDILWQFFLESTYLTFGAGALGMAAGWGAARALAPLSDRIWPPVITWELALVGFVVLTTVGLLAGLLPARRAARLPPAVALRAEV